MDNLHCQANSDVQLKWPKTKAISRTIYRPIQRKVLWISDGHFTRQALKFTFFGIIRVKIYCAAQASLASVTTWHRLGFEEIRCRTVTVWTALHPSSNSNLMAFHLFYAKPMSGGHRYQSGTHSPLTLTIPKNMNFNVCRMKCPSQFHQIFRSKRSANCLGNRFRLHFDQKSTFDWQPKLSIISFFQSEYLRYTIITIQLHAAGVWKWPV